MRVQTVQVAAYTPGEDSHGRTNRWGEPSPVEVYGWAPAKPDAAPLAEGVGRLPVTAEREVYPLAMAGGRRARWTFPDGTFEQIGDAIDYSEGPWWTDDDGAVVAYLRRTEG